jgi:hypothetical protein
MIAIRTSNRLAVTCKHASTDKASNNKQKQAPKGKQRGIVDTLLTYQKEDVQKAKERSERLGTLFKEMTAEMYVDFMSLMKWEKKTGDDDEDDNSMNSLETVIDVNAYEKTKKKGKDMDDLDEFIDVGMK